MGGSVGGNSWSCDLRRGVKVCSNSDLTSSGPPTFTTYNIQKAKSIGETDRLFFNTFATTAKQIKQKRNLEVNYTNQFTINSTLNSSK